LDADHPCTGAFLHADSQAGTATADPDLNAWLDDPSNKQQILAADNDYENFRNLIAGRIDGVLVDRLAGMSAAWRGGWERDVALQPMKITGDIVFLFNGRTVSPDMIARFDQAIGTLRDDGTLERVVARYQLPVLMGRVMDSQWFFVMDIVGTIAFALSGVLIALRERYSFYGALVLAALPAVGGGAIRDLIVGREPLGILVTPLYMLLVIGTVLAGYVTVRLLRLFSDRLRSLQTPGRQRLLENLYEVSDAIGLAAFTVTGLAVAISSRAEPLWLWGPLLAMLSGAGGGIVRDMVRQSNGIGSLHDAFYAEVPLIWGFLLVMFLLLAGSSLDPQIFFVAVVLTIVGAFSTRMAVVFLKLKSPSFG
jgi:polar amino acid transport system substrate-binding protein